MNPTAYEPTVGENVVVGESVGENVAVGEAVVGELVVGTDDIVGDGVASNLRLADRCS